MKPGNCQIFVILLWPAIIGCERVENEFSKTPFGALDALINKTLESSRPYLTTLFIEKKNFDTGPQEFGKFKGVFREVSFKGLENFRVTLLDTKFLDIRNLTIEVGSFTVKGFYLINGTLIFPLGKNDINVYGDGKFCVKFENCSISLKLIIRFENGEKIVKNLDIVVGLRRMDVYLENLMGGGDLERVFNKLINDVGLTVFNYYKTTILDAAKPEIIQMINKILNNQQTNICREEL